MSLLWQPVKPGAIIDIVAPSGTFPKDSLSVITAFLEEHHLKARIPENILGEDLFSANSDEIRYQLLVNALMAEDSDLIWCIRGGYGATRIADKLCHLPVPSKTKLIVGLSDITTLHLVANQHFAWPSLHGPGARQSATNMTVDKIHVEKMLELWFRGWQHYELGGLLRPLNSLACGLPAINGITAGTCLSLLQTSIGTSWQLQPEGKILFIEDVNEEPYRIDRMLTHMHSAGLFKGLKALVFGEFWYDSGDAEVISRKQELLSACLQRFADDVTFPVFSLPYFGHGSKNAPIPLGVPVRLQGGKVSFSGSL